MAHPIESFRTPPSGNFLSQKNRPIFENDVAGRPKKIHTDRSHSGVTFYKELYQMENGTRYVVTSSHISSRKRTPASSYGSLETSAWLTKDGGINKRRQLALAHLAIPSTFMGVQQNLRKIGNLEENAHNMHAINTHVAERFGRDKWNIIINGMSRGGMNGMGAHSIAGEYGINVLKGNYIVPCFPKGFDPVADLAQLPELVTNEASVIRSFKVPFNILRHYPNTLDASLYGMFQQVKEIPTLLSGKVGQMIQERMPQDAFMYVKAYGGDVMSQGYRWEELLSDYPNAAVDLTPEGGHLTCMSNDCYDNWYNQMEVWADIANEHGSAITTLGSTALHNIFQSKMNTQSQIITPQQFSSFTSKTIA